MPVTIRQLPNDELLALTPQSFNLAPIFDNLQRYTALHGALLVAHVDNQVAGCAALAYESTSSEKGTLHIDHFVILPHFRGHGLGSKLMQAIQAQARQNKINFLRAHIPNWCLEWRAFYSRFGFVFLDPATREGNSDLTPVELRLE